MNIRLDYQLPRVFFVISLLQSLLVVQLSVAGIQFPAGLVSPESGVLCNEDVKVCYDAFGVSIGLTEVFMGRQAADHLTGELSLIEEKYFDRTNFNPVRGVSCHTLEKACYEEDVLSTPLSTALFATEAGKYDIQALPGVRWAWDGSQYNNDTAVKAKEGREYSLIFLADGSLKIKADCNNVSAGYRSEGKNLSIHPGPSTMMACGADSQDQQFLRDLNGVAGWFLKKGDLYLDMKADAGTMRFYRSGSL